MFDEAFFQGEFIERAREFVHSREGLGLAVEFVTLGGERLDVLETESTPGGMRLVTRDDRLVFVPYAQIAHVVVSAQRDHRLASFQLRSGSS